MDHLAKVKQTGLTALVILMALAPLCAMAGEKEDALLVEARKLVESKRYDEAVEKYAQIADFVLADPGLRIELARVHTYADHHAEAIRIFEDVRRGHPERAAEFLRELADQYKWNDQITESVATYDEALEANPADRQARLGRAQALAWSNRHEEAIREYGLVAAEDPGSRDATLGMAEVFGWDDKLETAKGLYGQILKDDPGDANAHNGVSRMLVWQGYHREGAEHYEELLAREPRNLDAIEGLAFARHWQGRDDLSLKALDELLAAAPDRKAAREVFYVTQFSRYSTDKNHLRIATEGARSGLHVDPTFSVEALYSRQRLTQAHKDTIEANRGGVGFSKAFGDGFEINSFLYGTHFSAADFDVFTTSTWVTFKPGDMWRFDVSGNRETFEDIGALLNRITVDGVSGSFDFRPNRWWLFSAKYAWGDYSDDNRQDTVTAKVEYRLVHKPFLKLYYNFYYSDWALQLDNGYFNPISVNSHAAGLYSGGEIAKGLFAEVQVSAGYESQRPVSRHPIYSGAVGLNYRLSESWSLGLRGDLFDARPDSSNATGYSKASGMLSLTYNFGAAHTALNEATSPQRPGGSR
jgi:tetratricopeptide (TPR) repeat protein